MVAQERTVDLRSINKVRIGVEAQKWNITNLPPAPEFILGKILAAIVAAHDQRHRPGQRQIGGIHIKSAGHRVHRFTNLFEGLSPERSLSVGRTLVFELVESPGGSRSVAKQSGCQ